MGVRPIGRGETAMKMAGQMRPPLSSSQSPLCSVSACGENCARSLAPPPPTARGAAGAPHRNIKQKMRRARWKRKSASAGRSAYMRTSCRRRGKVGSPLRQSGTETRCPWGNLRPGEVWDTSCADFTRKGYAASLSGKAANGCAVATRYRVPCGSLLHQLLRGTVGGSEKRSSSMR